MDNFLSNDNMNLLWDVITDEDILKNRSKDVIDIVHEMFQTNINSFYDIEKRQPTSLVDLNKKYIMIILNYVNNIIARTNKEPQIQKDRRSQFEQDLTIKQQEFTASMTAPVPKTPIFNDNLDQPLSDIEKDIKKLTEQRKYDIEKINYNKADGWLKSKNTSIKQPNEIKYIKIDKETIVDDSKNIIDLQPSLKRHISWNDIQCEDIQCEDNNYAIENHVIENHVIENNIFSKLKSVKEKQHDMNELNIAVSELKHDLKEMNNKIEKMNTSIEDFLKLVKR